MRHYLKAWGVILGTSAIAAFCLEAGSSIPFSPFIAIIAIMGGAATCTIMELKNEERKREKKSMEKQTYQREKETYFSEQINSLEYWEENVKNEEMEEIKKEMNEMTEAVKEIIHSKNEMDQEEIHYVYSLLFEDTVHLIQSYSQLTEQEKKEQKEELQSVLVAVKEKLLEIKQEVNKRKDRKFEIAKTVLQEKLKRGL